MSEPRLEDIGDYNTLKGEKKKIIYAVILIGLVLGLVYLFVGGSYSHVDDQIKTGTVMKVSPTGTVSIPVK